MSFDSFSLLSPRIRRMMIIHSGESTQANSTQPSALRPLFLAMLAGMWIQKSHNTTKMATDTMINAASVICRYKLFLVIISANVQKIIHRKPNVFLYFSVHSFFLFQQDEFFINHAYIRHCPPRYLKTPTQIAENANADS